jgi:hypothetical protein
MWFFSALLAKIASAGAVAQAATGAGIVLVGFTGVGAAGALPAPVQHSFATVVASITPLTLPDDTETATDPAAPSTEPVTATDPVATTPAAPTTGSDDQAGDTGGSDAGAPAGATTTAPKNFGQLVSSLAHERNAERKAQHKSGSGATSMPAATSSEAEGSDDSGTDGAAGSTGDETSGDHSGSDGQNGHGHH